MNTTGQACDIPDLGPDVYARWRASEIGAITERLEGRLILGMAGDLAGRDVLDVGCGDGTFALELTRRGAVVTAVDASPAMIDAARDRAKQHHANATFQVATAEKLPYPAGQFDIVTAITILCFVEDAAPVFREMTRVLRPGGRLIIGELGRWSFWAAKRRIRAWLGSRLWRRRRGASRPCRPGGSGRRVRTWGDLLSAVGSRGAPHEPLRSFAEPAYHDRSRLSGARCDQARRQNLEAHCSAGDRQCVNVNVSARVPG
jgi:SAM-dependent methyltransferase